MDRTFKRAKTKPSEAYSTAAALQLSLLTLQRRGEVVRIRREDVDLDKNLWTIPAMNKKERRKGAVPLSPWAREILEEALRRSPGDWMFPGMAGEDHLKPKTVTRFLARLRSGDAQCRKAANERAAKGAPLSADAELLASAAMLDITPHDLRRTGRTKLTGEELHIDPMTAERVLNHSVGSRQQNAYDWNLYIAEKRLALDAWAGELRRIVEGRERPEPQSNVVTLQKVRT
jgi:integrase